MRLLFTGGGTAGHINPAVSVAEMMRQKEEDTKILFIGTKHGMESELIPRYGFDIEFINIHGFERKLSFSNIKVMAEFLSSIRKSKKIIKKFKPDAVIGTGGYVTGPVLYAASKLKIPSMVHESNAYPGVTVRFLADKVDIVALAMEEAKKFLKNPKRIEVTGNPIRKSISMIDKAEARKKLGLGDEKTVLIFGGSLGADYFNGVICDYICECVKSGKDYRFIMSAGKNNRYKKLYERFMENGVNPETCKNLTLCEYIYDMEYALNAVDLIIARSGSSVSEMLAAGKPAILIPSPNVAGNHQEHNARAVEKKGAAVVITENKLSCASLKEQVERILEDNILRVKMSKAAKDAAITDATEKLCMLIYELVKSRK